MTDEELQEALSELGDQEKFKDLEKDLKKLERTVYTYTDADAEAKRRFASAGGKETSSYRVAVRVKNDAKKRVNEEIARLEEKYGEAFSDGFLAGPKDLSREALFNWFSAYYFSARICAIPNMLSGFDLDTNQAALGAETMSHLFLGGSRPYSSPGFADQMEQAMQRMQPNYLRAPKMADEQSPSPFDETEPKPKPNLPQDELGSANVDFVMKEMFRLNARMKRNSRGTKPLKELTEKLDALEQRYQAGPELYRNMTRSELQKEMDIILNSVNEYMDAKSKQTSFSSTQLERLKCMNQLKSLRESLATIPGQEKFVYFNARSANLDYMKNALAEKLVLAGEIKSQKGNLMCDREQLRNKTNAFLQSDDFKLFLNDAIQKGTDVRNLKPERTIEILLKQNGQQMRKTYLSRVKELKQPAEAAAAAQALTETQRNALIGKAKAAVQASADYIELPAKIHNLVDNKFSRTASESEKMFFRFAVNHPSIRTGNETVGSMIKSMKKDANRITDDTYIREEISTSDNLARELSYIENACTSYIKNHPNMFDSLVQKELDDSTLVKQWPELNNNLGCYKLAYQYSDDPHAKSVIAKYDQMKARIEALAAGRTLNAKTGETAKKSAGPNLG